MHFRPWKKDREARPNDEKWKEENGLGLFLFILSYLFF